MLQQSRLVVKRRRLPLPPWLTNNVIVSSSFKLKATSSLPFDQPANQHLLDSSSFFLSAGLEKLGNSSLQTRRSEVILRIAWNETGRASGHLCSLDIRVHHHPSRFRLYSCSLFQIRSFSFSFLFLFLFSFSFSLLVSCFSSLTLKVSLCVIAWSLKLPALAISGRWFLLFRNVFVLTLLFVVLLIVITIFVYTQCCHLVCKTTFCFTTTFYSLNGLLCQLFLCSHSVSLLL